MEEPKFLQIEELQIKGIESFPGIGNQIKKHITKDLKEKDILYQREYRILFISSHDETVEKFIFWMTDHFRMSGIKIRIFHRKECVFEPPYTHYNNEGILMTFAETVATIISRNIYVYDTFFFLTINPIPEKHTDNIWLTLQEKIQQNIAYHRFLLNIGIKQKTPSR